MALKTVKSGKKIRSYQGPGCPSCNRPIPRRRLSSGQLSCTYCKKDFEAAYFVPPVKKTQVARVSEVGPDGAAVCANHLANVAVADCERCGAFICNLCKIDSDDLVLCPSCFGRMSDEGELGSTVTTFRDYAGICGTCTAASVLLWFLAPIFGPLAIYYGVKGLKQKKEMNERYGVIGLYCALVLAALITTGGIFLILAIAGVFK